MSFSYGRDRTDELRDSFEGRGSSDDFGPPRMPSGFRRTPSPVVRRSEDTNPFARPQSPQAAYPPPPPPQHHAAADTYEMQPRTPLPTDLNTFQGFLSEIEEIKHEIAQVSHNLDAIDGLHNSALGSLNEQQSSQIARELERVQSITRKQNAEIKDRLQKLQTATAQSPSEANMRQTHLDAVRKRFTETIRRYQEIETVYNQKYRQRVERQIRIVKPEATPEEVNDIIDSDRSNQLFSQSLLQAGRQGQARAVLSEVQTRHDDIKRIEKTLLELHQLFQDMEMLVERQGEVMVQIDQHAEQTAQDLHRGTTFVDRAIQSARATRHKKWCCLVIVIILCVVIAILVWWFGFNHKGVGDNP
ncbi:t-SNARE [Syncephalastrum racemosum]|uniref:t-SNARE n=1 Tax=Syncephalastrum racemosum TaxID=13706 RepID=A0A1X2HAX4_SYNRA|nr:t-SNARE [Syncephalastrum racemosum]